ncbi:GGDEF domain-containing protein [Blastococcus deserti]|uniref:Diguanylate cyclase n=1 Tax=Blastococcus deserti TaxID=2259033 RepID=A0ABW4X9I2_9ACTN
MRIGQALRARDPQVAGHSLRLISLVCAAVVSGWTSFQPPGTDPTVLLAHWLVVAALVLTAVLCTVLPADVLDRLGIGVVGTVLGVVLICALNLLTHDTSAAAQAFFAFPVLWAASNLRATGVVLVTATALAADCASLFVLLPPALALTDFVFVGAALTTMAVMLARANAKHDRLVRALEAQVTVDSLTGLATRRAFDGALEAALSRSVPGGTALVLIDVDSFKSINDNHGHPVGDDVLVHLAGVLRSRVRAEDAVLSRLGGDELAVLLPGCGRDVAALRAEHLLQAVRSSPMTLADGTLLALSISVGVAHLPQHSNDRRGLYVAADSALYEAKRAGRGRVSVAAT